MKDYTADKIKNIALVGHGGRGKTTLAEAMLFLTGTSKRFGSVEDGTTTLDTDPEEKRRRATISTALAPLEWNDTKLNFIDTPGLFDFAGGMREGLRAAEVALIVTAAGSGYDVGAEKAFLAAQERGIGKVIVISKVDAEHTNFYKTISILREIHGHKICPVVVPYYEGEEAEAYVNLLTGKAYSYTDGKATEIDTPSDAFIEEMNNVLMEAIAGADEELMEKYFEDEPFTEEEIVRGLKHGILDKSLYPVFGCSGLKREAIDLLLDGLTSIVPSAKEALHETAKTRDGDDVELACNDDDELAAICFKTIADPFVGKLSFLKVVSGTFKGSTRPYNPRTRETERFGKLIMLRGTNQIDIDKIVAGDIGVVTKLDNVRTGDTLCSEKRKVVLEGIRFPKPNLSMTIIPKKQGEEDKIGQGLARLLEEDPTIRFEVNSETKQQVLSGFGEQHLDVIVSKLKDKYNVGARLETARVPYRETIRKTIEIQGRHKKQSGGHGQFGDVWIRFEPAAGEEKLVFEEKVFGGSVPRNYFPAVEKGLEESMKKGILAGYPMVGLKAVLYDGSHHPVDSSEMAFKLAASAAFRHGIPDADPTILEPVGLLKAIMPEEQMGDIMSAVTKRRGRVLGIEPASSGFSQINAEVPMAEMGDFAIFLRSATRGRGTFTFDFVRYEEAPQSIALQVIESANAAKEN